MFEIAGSNRANDDSKGDVRIQIIRTDKGKFVKGNLSKSIVVKNAKVSDVHTWLEGQINGTNEAVKKTPKAAKVAAE